MKLYIFILLVLTPLFLLAQGENNLVFHFQTKANNVVSDFDLIVGDKVTVWQETTDPERTDDGSANVILPSSKKYERKLLFKERNGNVCISKYDPWKGLFYLRDTLSNLYWTIKASPKVSVLGYKCSEAGLTFRGREYRVWYTTQIPVAEGPWKLSGLPGMILKVQAKGGGDTYEMECYGIDRHATDTRAMLESYLRRENIREFLSWSAFVDAFENHLTRRISEIRATMAEGGDSGFSLEYKLDNNLEIFSPDLQGDGLTIEF